MQSIICLALWSGPLGSGRLGEPSLPLSHRLGTSRSTCADPRLIAVAGSDQPIFLLTPFVECPTQHFLVKAERAGRLLRLDLEVHDSSRGASFSARLGLESRHSHLPNHGSSGIEAVRISGPFAVTSTVSSIRTPPVWMCSSASFQFTHSRKRRRRTGSCRIAAMK